MKIVYEFSAYETAPEVMAEVPTPIKAVSHLRAHRAQVRRVEGELEYLKMRTKDFERQLVDAQTLVDSDKATIEDELKLLNYEYGDLKSVFDERNNPLTATMKK